MRGGLEGRHGEDGWRSRGAIGSLEIFVQLDCRSFRFRVSAATAARSSGCGIEIEVDGAMDVLEVDVDDTDPGVVADVPVACRVETPHETSRQTVATTGM